MAQKKVDRFDVYGEVDVRVHNDIMAMYASDEQLARLSDIETRPLTESDIKYYRERRCKYY